MLPPPHPGVRRAFREIQERERRQPPCRRCGRPIITTRLAIGPVRRVGIARYRGACETAEDLGACTCPHTPMRREGEKR